MSLRNGDRARAHKVMKKQRVRRIHSRLMRRLHLPTPDPRVELIVPVLDVAETKEPLAE